MVRTRAPLVLLVAVSAASGAPSVQAADTVKSLLERAIELDAVKDASAAQLKAENAKLKAQVAQMPPTPLPTPVPIPAPTPVPAPAAWPTAASTGVREGVMLKDSGSLTISKDSAIVSGLRIKGRLTIQANNVTVRDCRIENAEYHAILIPEPYKATVEYSDIIGGTNGISGAGTFRFNDFSKNDNGLNLYGSSLVEGNFIHDMASINGEPHYDGIEINGGGGHVIRGNWIENRESQTSAVMIDNYFGAVDNIVIEGNYLSGGDYTIYSDGSFNSSKITNIVIRNNTLGKGFWGYFAFKGNEPALSGNVDAKTGKLLQ